MVHLHRQTRMMVWPEDAGGAVWSSDPLTETFENRSVEGGLSAEVRFDFPGAANGRAELVIDGYSDDTYRLL